MIPANEIIISAIKARMEIAGFNLNNAEKTTEFLQIMVEEIISAVKQATVNTNITVSSVSGVTPGAGISGPGTGTGSGGIQ